MKKFLMMKGKYLITTDSWFLAPDGKQYRAVWGDVKIVDDSILGIKTNRNSSNWFAVIIKFLNLDSNSLHQQKVKNNYLKFSLNNKKTLYLNRQY